MSGPSQRQIDLVRELWQTGMSTVSIMALVNTLQRGEVAMTARQAQRSCNAAGLERGRSKYLREHRDLTRETVTEGPSPVPMGDEDKFSAAMAGRRYDALIVTPDRARLHRPEPSITGLGASSMA
jgi:hypothetical protein